MLDLLGPNRTARLWLLLMVAYLAACLIGAGVLIVKAAL